jgi:rsbT co-antagonist protein RsbR
VRVEAHSGKPEIDALLSSVNQLLEQSETTANELHSATMDLALGLSECFGALSAVRGGNLEARVSKETLESSDELLSRFGHALNDTFDDIQLTIERQRYAIETLSTPILQVWNDVLALPVIGIVDSKRSAELMEKLLGSIVTKQARFVILDITGVDVVDTRTADHFIKLVSSAQLLGAECFVTGIQPAVAQTLVEIGVDLSSITTLRTLQDGLRECMRRLDGKKTRGPLETRRTT